MVTFNTAYIVFIYRKKENKKMYIVVHVLYRRDEKNHKSNKNQIQNKPKERLVFFDT